MQENLDKYNEPFPSRLRKLISERKTTITALASTLKISRQAVSQYCDGSAQPNVDKICLICDYFGVSADYLFGRTDEPSPDPDIKKACSATGLSGDAISHLKEIANYYQEELNKMFISEHFRELVRLLSVYRYCLIEMRIDDARHDVEAAKCAEEGKKYIDLRLGWALSNSTSRSVKLEAFECLSDIFRSIDESFKGVK